MCGQHSAKQRERLAYRAHSSTHVNKQTNYLTETLNLKMHAGTEYVTNMQRTYCNEWNLPAPPGLPKPSLARVAAILRTNKVSTAASVPAANSSLERAQFLHPVDDYLKILPLTDLNLRAQVQDRSGYRCRIASAFEHVFCESALNAGSAVASVHGVLWLTR